MEHDDYDTISLTYYSDNVLADEDNEIIEDVEGVVGEDSLNHFGEYEDDAVYVRNNARKVGSEKILRNLPLTCYVRWRNNDEKRVD